MVGTSRIIYWVIVIWLLSLVGFVGLVAIDTVWDGLRKWMGDHRRSRSNHS